MDIEKTLEARGGRYGEFIDNATIAQEIKESMRRGKQWENLDLDMKEALDIIAGKISRLLTGDPFYLDNWHDMIGYVRLIEKRLEKSTGDASKEVKEG